MEYYAVIETNNIMSFAGVWMDLELVHVLCRDMYGVGSHHLQQTNTGTENQAPPVLTHKWELNNENTWTRGGEHHTLGPPVRAGGKKRESIRTNT